MLKKGQVEVKIKEEFIKIFKKYVGKGPKNSIVRISRNFVIIEFEDVLTLVEKNLLERDRSINSIESMRNNLMDISIDDYISVLENCLNVQVIDNITKVNLKDNVIYGIFILSRDIEKEIENNKAQDVI